MFTDMESFRIYSDKNVATNAAKATYGLVTDNRGHKIWVFEENYN